MAVTKREQEMLDLVDAGLTQSEIADEMGMKVASVRRTLSALDDRPGPDQKREQCIRMASEQLADAVCAAGGYA